MVIKVRNRLEITDADRSSLFCQLMVFFQSIPGLNLIVDSEGMRWNACHETYHLDERQILVSFSDRYVVFSLHSTSITEENRKGFKNTVDIPISLITTPDRTPLSFRPEAIDMFANEVPFLYDYLNHIEGAA